MYIPCVPKRKTLSYPILSCITLRFLHWLRSSRHRKFIQIKNILTRRKQTTKKWIFFPTLAPVINLRTIALLKYNIMYLWLTFKILTESISPSSAGWLCRHKLPFFFLNYINYIPNFASKLFQNNLFLHLSLLKLT